MLRGGVVAYATEVKLRVLDVPADLLARHGAVHPDVAMAMASGVRVLLGADLGVATTGVAGPDPVGGHRPGRPTSPWSGPRASVVSLPAAAGADRAAVRAGAVTWRWTRRCAMWVTSRGERWIPPERGMGQ